MVVLAMAVRSSAQTAPISTVSHLIRLPLLLWALSVCAVEYGERLVSDERLLCDWIAGCAGADASELQLFRIVARSRLA